MAKTHPNLSFAVHQCTKFSYQPNFLHEKAIKHFGWHLHLTCHQGLILQPTPEHPLIPMSMQILPVAGIMPTPTSVTVASQEWAMYSYTAAVPSHGLASCRWKLPTTEADYQALLSKCMCDLLPLHTLIQQLMSNSFVDHMYLHRSQLFSSTLKSTVYGDNQTSCLIIATTDANCKWTKHLPSSTIILVIKSSMGQSKLSKFTSMTTGQTFSWSLSPESSLNGYASS